MNYLIKKIAKILNISSSKLKDATISTLLTDSRSLTYPEESLFFAIRTKNNDGHNYIAQLYQRGVRNFVVDNGFERASEFPEANFLVVKDTTNALQMIAAYHRKRFSLPVIGITGSRGKTTVKEWLNQLLQEDYNIVRSPRSYNSQIGVPLSLWKIEDNSTLAIIEAGISLPDEMAPLESMICPNIGIITNLNNEHNEGFSSMQQKCEEKALLLRKCDCVIYNADDELISETLRNSCSVAQEIAWSRKDADRPLFISKTIKHGGSTTIIYNYIGRKMEAVVPFVRDSDIENAINCIATMLYLHKSQETIAERMNLLTSVGTRLNVIEGVNNCLIISDAYTSDYNSLAPAIDFMSRRSTSRRGMTVILSDVLHESFTDSILYKKVAELLTNKSINRFIGIGTEMMRHSKYFDVNSRFFASSKDFFESMSPSDFENELILIKGAPNFHFGDISDMLEAKQHETVLEVNLDAVTNNYNFFRSHLKPETKIVCMVKASGYGAGSYELAKTLQDSGAAYLAVAVLDEGVDLRKADITMPIMVLNPMVVNYKAMFSYQLEPEIFSIEMCREIIHEAEKFGITNYPVHIKLDTGMHRLGFLKEQLPELIELLNSQSAIKPCSVFSHLAVADDPSMDDYTMQQFDYFDECCVMLQAGFEYHILRHILNTTGIIRFPEEQFDMVRLGIGLYGISTTSDGSEDELSMVSALHSVIISIKPWGAGTTIGYGRKGLLKRDSLIATIPIGYADGLDRHLGNGGCNMYINGVLCPTIGNLCMDVCMVDVTDVICSVGDTVEIFGEHIPVTALSDRLDTIPYEILTSISTRVKRIYYRE
ncbi:MAG: bifunctional UDP-N-acetylmuramoyl-tripeptide:D-alanyl-D-alanine ligase/alanine racemase [Muribaculaceae bacterium]